MDHMASGSIPCRQPTCLRGNGMRALRIQGTRSMTLATFLLRGQTPVPPPPEDPTPARSPQSLVFALMALLVALVHHCWSYSVTLGNRMSMFRLPRQMLRLLGRRVTKRD